VIPPLLDLLEAEGRPLVRLTTRHVSLEDVFVALTGRHLRDDEAEVPARNGNGSGRGRRRRARL
jgi:ABC-2 type transport system ATP-binding protein